MRGDDPLARRRALGLGLHRRALAQPEDRLDLTELGALEPGRRLEPVAERLELERGHRLEDVDLGDEGLEDLQDPVQQVEARVGVAGLVLAGVTGGMLVGRNSTIEEQCPDKHCSQEGIDTIDGNGPLVALHYVGLGVGIVGIGVGAYLILTSGGGSESKAASVLRSTPVTASVLPGGAGVSIRSAF